MTGRFPISRWLAFLGIALCAMPAYADDDQAWLRESLEPLDRSPRLTVTPVYPKKAWRERRQARVIVCFRILADGSVKKPYVFASSDRLFNKSALRAIKASSYVPVDAATEPVDACRTFGFRLQSLEKSAAGANSTP